jgi:RNA polymerase sigma-70 factor, ECF subfamily
VGHHVSGMIREETSHAALIVADLRRRSLSARGDRRVLGRGAGAPQDEPLASRRSASFEDELIAQLRFLHLYARSLTRDRDRASDLVQDTCERALRGRALFDRATNMRGWLGTIMRNRFADLAKRRDPLARAGWLPLDALGEAAGLPPRAEGICLAKEALRLAADRLSADQASVFWPAMAGARQRDCAALCQVPQATAATRLHRARSLIRRTCAA